MSAFTDLGLAWLCVGCFALTVVSAVIPWVNAEVIVLSLPAFASSRWALLLLVLVATAGQMTGKLAIYWAGRGGATLPSPKVAAALDRWAPRFRDGSSKAAGLIVLSSAVGIPPFFVTTLLAGAVRMRIATFLVAGTCGRIVRFGTLVLAPQLIAQAMS
jgi:membrane protein YqaA with SNARE-associated domain